MSTALTAEPRAPRTLPSAQQSPPHAIQREAATSDGTAGMPFYLRSVQCDGPTTTPRYQLQPPSLLQPQDPMEGLRLFPQYQYQLSPEIEAMLATRFVPGSILATLAQLDAGASTPSAPSSGSSGTGAVAPTPTATPSGAGQQQQPTPPPSTPSTTPTVPRGAGPSTPRQGTAGDVFSAVSQVPAVQQMITNLRTQALGQVRRDWSRLNTGERVATISMTTLIAAGLIGGAMSQPDLRQQAFGALNGRIWPIPGVDGLSLELRFMGPDLLFGVHMDVGRWLPPLLGFGPSSPTPFGAPPRPRPFVLGELPSQRKADGAGASPAPAAAASTPIARRIESAEGHGTPLAPGLHHHLETTTGKQIPEFRLHTDARAHALAESLQATAFTSGRDVFFRNGAYKPQSSEGMKLLAHEAVHVAQQAVGPVSGVPVAGGVSVSDPGDAFEHEAEHLSNRTAGLPLYLDRAAHVRT